MFCLLDNSLYKSQLCSDPLHYFSLSFLASSTSLLYLPFVSLFKYAIQTLSLHFVFVH